MASYLKLDDTDAVAIERSSSHKRQNVLVGSSIMLATVGACFLLLESTRSTEPDEKQAGNALRGGRVENFMSETGLPQLGGDRTSHGCIPSAGYAWCAALSSCIRSWEHNISSQAEFVARCVPETFDLSGSDRDSHGCIPSAGYRYCAQQGTCIRPWEEHMSSEHDFNTACAVDEKTYQCQCPPSEARTMCSKDEYEKLMAGVGCPYYQRQEQQPTSLETQMCNCPPSNAMWPCSDEEHAAIMNGKKCKFYKRTTELVGKKCNCPPSYAEWDCSDAEYQSIMDGTKCPYYKENAQTHTRKCNCPPSYAIWDCSERAYNAIRNGSSCPFYAHKPLIMTTLGGDRDKYGCFESAGYSWCKAQTKCIRPWEHNVKSEQDFVALCSEAPTAIER